MKAARWTVAHGLSVEGAIANAARAVDVVTPVTTCRTGDRVVDVAPATGASGPIVVVNEHGVVVGLVPDDALTTRTAKVDEVMRPGPSTLRPVFPPVTSRSTCAVTTPPRPC
jgi:hypothetical protein